MSEQFVQPTELPAPQGDTAIPRRLAEYFTANGFRWSLQPMDNRWLSAMRSKGIDPFRPETLKKENPELYDACFGKGTGDDIVLFIEPDNGYVQIFDCVLTTQPQEVWERTEREVRERIAALEAGPAGSSLDPEKIAEALETLGLATHARAKTEARSLDVIAAELTEAGEI